MYDATKPYKKEVLNLIKETWNTPYVSVENNVVEKKFSFNEYHHSDGIGTKGLYHWAKRSFKNAVIDSLAMNLNDLAVNRTVPYAVVDHLFMPEDDNQAIVDIIRNLSFECKKRNIAITGGETSIHDNIKGMDISMTMLGFIEKPKLNKFLTGDALIGIESKGLHSNGFTKIAELFGREFRNEFIEPTNIYYDLINRLNKKFTIHGMMHITGGAFTKLKDVLQGNDAVIFNNHKLKPREIFFDIYKRRVSDEDMYKIFNCGIGFVLSVSKSDVHDILNEINEFKADEIGEVKHGNGNVIVHSMFSRKKVEL